MSRRSEEETLLRNYLLGDLDEASREQVEQRLLSDDGFAERLSEAEGALIDDYVFDALSEGERKSFDETFVIDEGRRKRILFARALEIYVEGPRPPEPSASDDLRTASPLRKNPLPFIKSHKISTSVFALILLLLILSPVLLPWLKRTLADRRLAEVNRRPASGSVTNLLAFELDLQHSLLREGGSTQRAVLADNIKLLTLKLAPPEKRYESYNALVLTADEKELYAVGDLTPQVVAGVETIPLNIPADFLPTGDYQVQLRGNTADGSLVEAGRYKFRVIHEK
jgi:hypothetical protein